MTAGGLAAFVVRGYQLVVRPVLPSACRFVPGCSEYARQALMEHGLARGAALALRRIARCHPWNPGGYDPPPSRSRG
jgi:putative membrane protein insertion efficiency factor